MMDKQVTLTNPGGIYTAMVLFYQGSMLRMSDVESSATAQQVPKRLLG